MGEETFYDILGVRLEADETVIRHAWRLAIRDHHPDLVSHLGSDAELAAGERTSMINQAAWVLLDPQRRRDYDLRLGLRPGRCARCGEPGRLRLYPDGSARGACPACWEQDRPDSAIVT